MFFLRNHKSVLRIRKMKDTAIIGLTNNLLSCSRNGQSNLLASCLTIVVFPAPEAPLIATTLVFGIVGFYPVS